jgi:hypothetical protein
VSKMSASLDTAALARDFAKIAQEIRGSPWSS